MFQAFDNPGPAASSRRAHWMALLARAPLPLLESALGERAAGDARWLRAPETGLMMVQGRAGGSGERFHLGEVTVTRCALRLRVEAEDADAVGVSYIVGRSHRHVHLAAVADALLQSPAQHAAIDAAVLEPIRAHLAQQQAQRQDRARRTKVEFFTVAREAGDSDEEDSE
ncbi:MAG: phosphonate C-P lyase system protein PhnG [Burkholderiaceae bacterium]|nr:phosphonate C-P lyase system protein PhnG [Burkholderiaceae bacterium]